MEARSGVQYDLFVGFERKEFDDPVTLDFIIDPVKTACEHYLESSTAETLHKANKPCPYCRAPIYPLQKLDRFYLDIRSRILKAEPELYAGMPFDLDQFAELLQKNELKTKAGELLVTILRHAANHLNDKAAAGKQQGKSAVQVLASCPLGRNLLRESEEIRALISEENKQLVVEGKSIVEWLAMPKEEIEVKVEPKAHKGKKKVRRPALPPAPRPGLFAPNPANLVDSICRRTVYGKEAAVEEMIRVNPTLVFVKDTVIDHVGREVDNASPYQIALRMGDMEMAKMIKRVAVASTIPNAQQRLDEQYMEVFPNGHDAHLREQQENTFDFTAIKNAIDGASERDLRAALNKENNGSPLCNELDAFRNLFTAHSLSEKIYNPNHLQKAFDVYNTNFDRWNWHQRDLFWRQVIGYAQRYMPLCYMQAFCQGLYNLTEKSPRDALARDDRCQNYITDSRITLSNLDADPNCRLGYDFAVYSWAWALGAYGAVARLRRVDGLLQSTCYESCVKQKHRNCRAYAPRTPSAFSRVVRSLLR